MCRQSRASLFRYVVDRVTNCSSNISFFSREKKLERGTGERKKEKEKKERERKKPIGFFPTKRLLYFFHFFLSKRLQAIRWKRERSRKKETLLKQLAKAKDKLSR